MEPHNWFNRAVKLSCFLCLAPFILLAGFRMDSLAGEAETAVFPPLSKYSDYLEVKIQESLKELGYSEELAQDFIQKVRPWKLEVLFQKICEAAQDVKQKKISWDQYARVETETLHQLAKTITTNISEYDIRYFDLALIIKNNKRNALVTPNCFTFLGSSLGLAVRPIVVTDAAQIASFAAEGGHAACVVELHNGSVVMVDLTQRNRSSGIAFRFNQECISSGIFWEFMDDRNGSSLGINAFSS